MPTFSSFHFRRAMGLIGLILILAAKQYSYDDPWMHLVSRAWVKLPLSTAVWVPCTIVIIQLAAMHALLRKWRGGVFQSSIKTFNLLSYVSINSYNFDVFLLQNHNATFNYQVFRNRIHCMRRFTLAKEMCKTMSPPKEKEHPRNASTS